MSGEPSSDDRTTGPAPDAHPPVMGDPSHPGHPSSAAADQTGRASSRGAVAGGAERADAHGGADGDEKPLTVEDLLAELESVIAQRDEYLGLAQAKQAEFENYRKRTMKQQADELARASAKLVEALLPVLDAFDYAVAHGDESVVPLRAQLLGVLEREGLSRLAPAGDDAFDPNEHDAVAHEPGDGGQPVVAETLRAGYRWQGHLLRPVMVRVRD